MQSVPFRLTCSKNVRIFHISEYLLQKNLRYSGAYHNSAMDNLKIENFLLIIHASIYH